MSCHCPILLVWVDEVNPKNVSLLEICYIRVAPVKSLFTCVNLSLMIVNLTPCLWITYERFISEFSFSRVSKSTTGFFSIFLPGIFYFARNRHQVERAHGY